LSQGDRTGTEITGVRGNRRNGTHGEHRGGGGGQGTKVLQSNPGHKVGIPLWRERQNRPPTRSVPPWGPKKERAFKEQGPGRGKTYQRPERFQETGEGDPTRGGKKSGRGRAEEKGQQRRARAPKRAEKKEDRTSGRDSQRQNPSSAKEGPTTRVAVRQTPIKIGEGRLGGVPEIKGSPKTESVVTWERGREKRNPDTNDGGFSSRSLHTKIRIDVGAKKHRF